MNSEMSKMNNEINSKYSKFYLALKMNLFKGLCTESLKEFSISEFGLVGGNEQDGIVTFGSLSSNSFLK